MIVDSIPNGSGEDCGSDVTPCGKDEDATAIGSLFPVFSKKTKRIYKNIKCAKCHGLEEVGLIQWNAYLFCDGPQGVDASTVFQFLAHNQTMDPICHFRFYYPGQISDISKERCYPEVIGTCLSDNEFPITEMLNMTRGEIRHACISTFNSPVLHGYWYKNIFCAICNDKYYRYEIHQSCVSQEGKKDFEKVFEDYVFSALIRPDELKQLHVPMTSQKYDQPMACPVSNKNNNTECRLVHCPSAQIRQADGECIYPSQYWSVKSISLYLKLFPEHDVNVSAINNIDFDRMIANKSLSVSPWSKFWQVGTLMYKNKTKIGTTSDIVDYFLVRMVYGKTRINLKTFMQTIENSLNKALLLYFDDHLVPNKQEFSEFTEFYFEPNDLAVPKTYILGEPPLSLTENLTVSTFRVLFFHHNVFMIPGITLTKIFFCEQILLKPGEYEYSNQIKILRLESTGRVLFSGEIARAYDAYLGYVPKLCLEDSDFIRHIPANSAADGWNKKYMHPLAFAINVVLTVAATFRIRF